MEKEYYGTNDNNKRHKDPSPFTTPILDNRWCVGVIHSGLSTRTVPGYVFHNPGGSPRQTTHLGSKFRPGSTIRFLPEACFIRLDPPLYDFLGTSPEEPPQWVEIYGPQTKVGMSTDNLKGKKQPNKDGHSQVHYANEPITMRPTARKPYYEFIDSGERIVAERNIHFNPNFEHRIDRLREAYRLVRLYYLALLSTSRPCRSHPGAPI